MNPKNQVNPRPHGIIQRMIQPPHLVWYCSECKDGPLDVDIDAGCASCGKWNTFQLVECVGGMLEKPVHDILLSPRNQEPPRSAALPSAAATTHVGGHVLHRSSGRAATPYKVNTTCAIIPNVKLTTSPQIPHPSHQAHDPGTSAGAGTQYETPEQRGNRIPWELFGVGGCGIDPLCAAPFSESFHDRSWSPYTEAPDYDHGAFISPHSSPQSPDVLRQPSAQLMCELAFHYDQAQLSAGVHLSHDTTNIPIDVSVSGRADQPIQAYANPILSGGGATTNGEPLNWPAYFPEHHPSDLQVQNDPREIIPPWRDSVNNNHLTPSSQPQLSLVASHDSTESPSPAPSASSSGIVSSSPPRRARAATTTTAKVPLRHYKCCGTGEHQRLACLFYKYDPQRHVGCIKKTFATIGHLKQHLKNVHSLGPNHCKVCWHVFETAESLAAHEAMQCCSGGGGGGGVPVNYLPRFPRISQSMDRKWYWGWRKLFGEDVEPPQCPFSHPFSDLRAQFREPSSSPGSGSSRRRRGDKKGTSPTASACTEASPSASSDWSMVHAEAPLNTAGCSSSNMVGSLMKGLSI